MPPLATPSCSLTLAAVFVVHCCVQVQAVHLPLLYLRHSRSWRLMREFVLSDGLQALVDLFTNTNAYIRSQAMYDTNALVWCCFVHRTFVAFCIGVSLPSLLCLVDGAYCWCLLCDCLSAQ